MKQQNLFYPLLSVLILGGVSNGWAAPLKFDAFQDVVKNNAPASLDAKGMLADLTTYVGSHQGEEFSAKTIIPVCKAHVNAPNPCDICYKFTMDVVAKHNDLVKKERTETCAKAGATYENNTCVCPNGGGYDRKNNECIAKIGAVPQLEQITAPGIVATNPIQALCEQDGVGKYVKGKCNCPKPNVFDDTQRCLKPETVAKLEQEKAAKTEQAQNAEQTAGSDEIKIVINLDGGTAVSGNCGDHTVKSGTPIKLDCVAVKGTKKLSSYVDERGNGYNKDWQFGFNGTMSQAERSSAVPHTLKAVYEEDASTTKTPSSEIKETSANSSSTVASATTSEQRNIHCDINGSTVHLDKVSDAKTPTDLVCVSKDLAENKCIQTMGNGSGIAPFARLCDANTKSCVYYCRNAEKIALDQDKAMEKAQEESARKIQEAFTSGRHLDMMSEGMSLNNKVDIDFTSICCSVNGESVSCRTGRKFTLKGGITTRPQPTLNDCN